MSEGLLVGFGCQERFEASPEQREYLLLKVHRWFPSKTEAEAYEFLHSMNPSERMLALMNHHPLDDTSGPGDRYHTGGYEEPRPEPLDDGWPR